MIEDDFTVNRQINFCQEYWRLKLEGYIMHPLDETFVNANYAPKRIIHDTTIKYYFLNLSFPRAGDGDFRTKEAFYLDRCYDILA